ncbi:MAG: cupredoxin domain-containing protein [Chloroflexota bacterium]
MIEVQDSLHKRLSRRSLLKYTGTVFTASALAGLIAACGGDDDDDEEDTEPTATADDQAQDEDPTATEEDDEPTATEAEPTETEEEDPTATEEEDEPTATEEPTSTPEPTATEEPEPTATEEPSPTEEPTSTPEPTATEEPEPTATEEPEPTPEPTNTPEPEPTPTEAAPEPQTYTVNMTDDMVFDPAQLSINVGDTVVWENVGEAPHTATCDPDLAMDPASVNLPEGAAPWDTGMLNGGESGSHTFDTPGEYTYFCIPHETIGMIASISVAG